MHTQRDKLLEINKEINNKIKELNFLNYYPKVIAVSKTFSIDKIQPLIDMGHSDFGENRVQEAYEKWNNVKNEKIKLHLIGKLQTNKVNKAVGTFDVIQTVDSIRLAEKINKRAQALEIYQPIFIQINIGEDSNKSGMPPKSVYKEIETITKLKHVHLLGIMTILPLGLNEQTNQQLFKKTKDIQVKVQTKISPTCKFLSMGMSGDYKLALKEGATHIRIGTKLYGNRK